MNKQVVLITGASRGIGRATAIEFAKQHWITVMCARNYTALSIVAEEIAQVGGVECLFRSFDIRDSITPLALEIIEKYGRIDALINNAGMALKKPFNDMDRWSLEEIIETNLMSPIQLTRTILPYLQKQKQSWIVNVLSSAAKFGFPEMVAYCASKHGLLGFTRALAAELKNTNVKVVGVCPARVDTEMHRKLFPEAYGNHLLRRTIMTPETVAKKIVQIVTSNEVRNGQIINIDPWHTNLYHTLKCWLD
jgi:3-oxoacyl-[acyl-carrier protein] reductase